jgi:hypothetical protein
MGMADRQNQVRVSDSDVEIAALKALDAALAKLDLETCTRVLNWANDRFVRDPDRLSLQSINASLRGHTEALNQLTIACSKAGVKPTDFVLAVKRLHDEAQKVADLDARALPRP